MGKNQLRTSLIKFNYEEEIGVFVPEVDYHELERGRTLRSERWGNCNPYHDIDGVGYYEKIRRILVEFQGKPFDDAFSKYCTKVPIYQQHLFLKNINKSEEKTRGRYHHNTHFVDENGLIQSYPNVYNGRFCYKQNHYVVTSLDYKTELRHKVTGAKKPKLEYSWSTLPYRWQLRYPGMTKAQAEKAFNAEYEEVCISGWKKEFETNCREYRRLYADIAKQSRKKDRIKAKEDAKKAYNFLTKAEQEQKKYAADNARKITRKGFDLVTSFRNDKQTNPDLIKQAQGFVLSNFDFWE